MNNRMITGLCGVALLVTASAVWAATSAVVLKGQAFSTLSLKVNRGDTVEFRNGDTVYHDIFSLSDNATFDLGSFGPGEVRRTQFNTPGKVEIECGVHRGMKMTVEVK